MSGKYTIGLDFGTNSVRALVVDVRDGRELGEGVSEYAHGNRGVILDANDPHLARQHPGDYLAGIVASVGLALKQAATDKQFSAKDVIGIGVDTTGSTPLPVDANGQPLAFNKKFGNNPAAMAWLWKDHTGVAEAAQILHGGLKARADQANCVQRGISFTGTKRTWLPISSSAGGFAEASNTRVAVRPISRHPPGDSSG